MMSQNSNNNDENGLVSTNCNELESILNSVDEIDDGDPSKNILKDFERALKLSYDERHLVAYDLYCNARNRFNQEKTKKKTNTDLRNVEEEVSAFISEHNLEFKTLETRALLFTDAKENMNSDDDWTFSQTSFGISTYYRRESDLSLSLKLEGGLEGTPLFEQFAVLREGDLYNTWAPFCTSSKQLAQLGRLDFIGWLNINILSSCRDMLYRGIGCDCMMEDGSIIIVGDGIKTNDTKPDSLSYESYLTPDAILNTIDFPHPPKSFNSSRMDLKLFQAVINIISPSSVRTKILANIDPKLKFIPTAFIDLWSRKIFGILLLRLQGAAKNALKDPLNSPLAVRIRGDVGFYHDWLLPKFQLYCKQKGWDMPPVKALGYLEGHEDEVSDISEQSISATFKLFLKEMDFSTKSPLVLLRERDARLKEAKSREINEKRNELERKLRPVPLNFKDKKRLEHLRRIKQKMKNQENLVENKLIEKKRNWKPVLFLIFQHAFLSHGSVYFFLTSSSPNSSTLNHIISSIGTLITLAFLVFLHSYAIHYSLLHMFDVLELACTHNHDSFLEGRRLFSSEVKHLAQKLEILLMLLIVSLSYLAATFGSYYFEEEVTWKQLSFNSIKKCMSYTSTFIVISITLLEFFLTPKNKDDKLQNKDTHASNEIYTSNEEKEKNDYAQETTPLNDVDVQHQKGFKSKYNSLKNEVIISILNKSRNEILRRKRITQFRLNNDTSSIHKSSKEKLNVKKVKHKKAFRKKNTYEAYASNDQSVASAPTTIAITTL